MKKQITFLILAAIVATGCTSVAPKTNTNADNKADTTPLTVDDGTKESASFIRLTSPQPGQKLNSPFLVGGEASLPSDTVYIRVKKLNEDVAISTQTRISKDASGKAAFGALITFVFQATESGTVEVYGMDPDTGEEIALESVEVNFDTTSSRSAQSPAQ